MPIHCWCVPSSLPVCVSIRPPVFVNPVQYKSLPHAKSHCWVLGLTVSTELKFVCCCCQVSRCIVCMQQTELNLYLNGCQFKISQMLPGLYWSTISTKQEENVSNFLHKGQLSQFKSQQTFVENSFVDSILQEASWNMFLFDSQWNNKYIRAMAMSNRQDLKFELNPFMESWDIGCAY